MTLRILATTDLHANLMPHDYFRDRPCHDVGLAATAQLIAAARAGGRATLLLDNGDLLQGSPMGDVYAAAGGLPQGMVHPMIAAMNHLGYDAATVGNHDFNFGIDTLVRSYADATFPVVLSNVDSIDRNGNRSPFLQRSVILERALCDSAGRPAAVRIGVIGFVPPQIMRWDRTLLRGRLAVGDIVAAASAVVPQLRAEGADLVIALAHSGIGAPDHSPGMENAAVPLAMVPGIDVLILGHSHLVFPSGQPYPVPRPGIDPVSGAIHGKPCVMAGAFGSHLGVIDLRLRRDGAHWSVAGAAADVRRVAAALPATGPVRSAARPTADPDPVLTGIAARAHAATLDYIRRPVGRTEVPLHSYFSLLGIDHGLKLLADAQREAVQGLLEGGGAAAGLPVLSAVAPLKSGGRAGPDHYADIPAGPLALHHCADLYPFPNFVRALGIDGAGLAEWLERAAAMFLRVTPGLPDQPLRNPEHPSYNFDMIDGVTYRIDLSQPARYGSDGDLLDPGARRVADLCYRGLPVARTDRFVVATNSYRAQGGGDFPGMDRAEVLIEATMTNRDQLIRYLSRQPSVRPEPDRTWGFRHLPDTSVVFETGPRAADHLGDVAHLGLHGLGLTADGYARYRLTL